MKRVRVYKTFGIVGWNRRFHYTTHNSGLPWAYRSYEPPANYFDDDVPF